MNRKIYHLNLIFKLTSFILLTNTCTSRHWLECDSLWLQSVMNRPRAVLEYAKYEQRDMGGNWVYVTTKFL